MTGNSFARERRFGDAAARLPLFLVRQFTGAGQFLAVSLRRAMERDHMLLWAVAGLALLILLGVQVSGGAYTAEFDGYPDEASHFMTGLMIRDFLVQLPYRNPVQWAEQYYVHYPRVAFGHWPPLFHFVEGVWWLLLPPSRVTAMLLIGLIGLAAAVCFYRIARKVAAPPLALFTACLLVATPVFQNGAGQVMSELPSLLPGVLFLDALIRFLERRSKGVAVELGIYAGLTLLVKGTGVSLFPAPFLALLFAGSWRSATRAIVVSVIALVTVSAAWYVLQGSARDLVLTWAGIDWSLPWSVAPGIRLAGAGCAALAVLGMCTLLEKRTPVAAASAAVVLLTAVTSFFLRAMSEPRHWILALPGILLLSLVCIRRMLEMRSAWLRYTTAAVAATAALVLFPWTHYKQQPVGYEQFAEQIKQPARMLVSAASPSREGSWIVLASLREPRPSSVIVRSTKSLARLSFNARHYRSLIETREKTEERLDRLGIQTVILDEFRPPPKVLLHHVLLRETVASSSSWKQCAKSGPLSAYCRVKPPRFEPEPLTIDLKWHLRRSISEE